jgi:hypothetical protein
LDSKEGRKDDMTVTVDAIMQLQPCYTRKEVKMLWAGRASLTIHEIADLDIPTADRIWALWRVIPADHQRRALKRTVARSVRNHALSHPSTRAWAEQWLYVEDRSVESVAEAAVWAVWTAVWAARAADVAATGAMATGAMATRATATERRLQINDILTTAEGS